MVFLSSKEPTTICCSVLTIHMLFVQNIRCYRYSCSFRKTHDKHQRSTRVNKPQRMESVRSLPLFPARCTWRVDIWWPSGQARGCQNILTGWYSGGPAGHVNPLSGERRKREQTADCYYELAPQQPAWEWQREKTHSLVDTRKPSLSICLSLSVTHFVNTSSQTYTRTHTRTSTNYYTRHFQFQERPLSYQRPVIFCYGDLCLCIVLHSPESACLLKQHLLTGYGHHCLSPRRISRQ